MTAIKKIEQRLAALEAELTKLKVANGKQPSNASPWDEWFGAFENDPIFAEAMKLGRESRDEKKPRRPKKRRPANDHS